MAKKVVSVALIHNKKIPIKNSNKTKKLKKVLKNVLNYMKSNTYMFAPLISSHSYNLTSSPASFGGEMSWEPMKEKEKKKLGVNVKDYLKSDCYMYAQLVPKDSDSDSASPHQGDQCGEKEDIGCVGDQMEPRMEETARQGGNTIRETENEDISNPTRRIVVKHNLLQRETVKHVVHQNCRSSSVPGKVLSQKNSRKIVVE